MDDGALTLQRPLKPPSNNAPRRHRLRLIALAVATLGLYSVAIFVGGIAAEKRGVADHALHRVSSLLERIQSANAQTVTWHEAVLNQHTLEWSRIRIGPNSGGGGGLVEIDGHIVFSTPHGRLNYLNRDNHLAPIGMATPMQIDIARAHPIANDPLFSMRDLRTHDLFARQLDSQNWELYVTFSRFLREDCFQFVLARTRLRVGDTITPAARGWEELYVARPGCIPYKSTGYRFGGQQASGRMQMLDARTMLISIGDHLFDTFNDTHNAPMDPEWDLGKLIAFDLETRQARIFATGLRNPQGLAILRDGRIIETEHGPQGGDEINVIQEGRNYGWPLVTYGMNYGYPRRRWESDPSPGGHGGYTRPALAFVPSIGISNIVQPSAEEFPLWGENDLLMGSLRANTLFHVRIDGDRVAYVEPLPFEGERLRDLVTLTDGRIAILTDSGGLIILRNAERHAREARRFTVSGYASLDLDEQLPTRASPVERGRAMFDVGCAMCHSLNGEAGIGPPLNGVVDRPIASAPGFHYSQALSAQSGHWSEQRLIAFITDPQHEIPGAAMPTSTLSWVEMPYIVDYLRTTRPSRITTPRASPERVATNPPLPALRGRQAP